MIRIETGLDHAQIVFVGHGPRGLTFSAVEDPNAADPWPLPFVSQSAAFRAVKAAEAVDLSPYFTKPSKERA